jgi:V/A-type H+-transporting ATPase subunit E
MSNLDNLTEKILADAREKAQAILDDSVKVKEDLVDSKIKEANDRKNRIIEKAAFEANLLKERVISNGELKVRNESLKAKQGIIDRVFDLAKKSLVELGDEDYVKYLKDTLAGLTLKGTETLIVTAPMKEKVKALDLGFKVSDEEASASGFLVKDKGVLLNYTFGDMVDFLRDELEADVASALFKE